jgi:hypothetical protein
MTTAEKQVKILHLLVKIDDDIFNKFFDVDSEKMLDKKIEVLEKLANGVVPADIPEYYDVLELYPSSNDIWD